MPNIVISIPEGILPSTSKHQLVARLNVVAAEVEQLGDDPRNRAMCWILIEEIAKGNWTCGNADATDMAIPVLAVIHLPSGVLDKDARSRYAAGVHEAIIAALPGEKRRILTSCMFNEVNEGYWSINGKLWALKDFARHAGFRHLQHLVETQPT
jgi:phenylpyruvate tautomerase PptA (4-oxalocrotonate tautomerase family)